MAEKLLEKTPETILINFKHTIVSEDKGIVVLEAERAEVFSGEKGTFLWGLYLKEYAGEGDLLTEGWAEHAVWYSDSEKASISGSIYIYSYNEQAGILAEELTWEKQGKNLCSDEDELIAIKKDDGSFLQGRGFEANFREKKIHFFKGVKGSYVWEEDD